jgi:hypothetical protein
MAQVSDAILKKRNGDGALFLFYFFSGAEVNPRRAEQCHVARA